MLESNKYIRISLKGNQTYDCLLTPDLIIVEVTPFNEFLYKKDLKAIWSQYRNLFSIDIKYTQNPIRLLNEDIYCLFKQQNKAIELLKNTFDCEL